MHSVVVYHSTYGNTERIAWKISEAISEICACDVHSIGEKSEIPIGIDLLVVGGPTKSHGIDRDLKYYLEQLPVSTVQGVDIAAFDTRLHVPELLSGSAAKGIAKRLVQMGGNLVVEPVSFFVEGNDGPLSDGELERASNWGRQIVASVATRA